MSISSSAIIPCHECGEIMRNDNFNGMFYCNNEKCVEDGKYQTQNDIKFWIEENRKGFYN